VSNRVVVVLGPTATGKSELGIELAHRLGGEVVNADSMQLYKGMDIGTAKLSDGERQGVVHHLLDIWPVTQTASVADYQARARAAIAEIAGRGVLPILVGGSGLYIRAVLDAMSFPGTDAEVRAGLEAELAASGPQALHQRLARIDPLTAAEILPTNGRKIVRALEVAAIGGPGFTGTMPAYASIYDAVLVGLDRPTAELDERLTGRSTRPRRPRPA
jgi:tRNA dimethylallyltransferase